jgi:hypothetical protein
LIFYGDNHSILYLVSFNLFIYNYNEKNYSFYCLSSWQYASAQFVKTNRFAANINLGTTPGLSFVYEPYNKLAIRASYVYLKYNLNQEQKISNENILLAGNMDMSAIGLSVEYYPFVKSSFKIIAGEA